MNLNIEKYILFPEVRLLGTYSTERLSSKKEVKCPWGGIETNPLDPGHKNRGLFERHGFNYPCGVIHVGMWKFEESEDYEYLVGSNLIGIEAHPDVYKNYSKITADLYGFQSFNFAASDEDDVEKNFYIAGEGSSLYSGPLEWNKTNLIKVKTKTLDTFVSEMKIDIKNYNFLNIDTEGSELKILKGFSKNLKYIDYIVLETSINDKFKNNQDLNQIYPFLKENGFEIKEIDGNFIHEQWGDIFFARIK